MKSNWYTNPGNFSLDELIFSDVAARRGLPNRPVPWQVEVLDWGAHRILQPIRDEFGPIQVTSGFRSPEVNRAVGGSRKSDHMILVTPKRPYEDGETGAFDIIPLRASKLRVFQWVWTELPWARLIWEFDRWIHISFYTHWALNTEFAFNRQALLLHSYKDSDGKTVTKTLKHPIEVVE